MAALGYHLCLLLWDRSADFVSATFAPSGMEDSRQNLPYLFLDLSIFQTCSPLALLKSPFHASGCWMQLLEEPINTVSICQLEGCNLHPFPLDPIHYFCSRTLSKIQKIPCSPLNDVLSSHQHTGQSLIVGFFLYCYKSFWVAKGLKTHLNLRSSNHPFCTHSHQWSKSHSLPAVERLKNFLFFVVQLSNPKGLILHVEGLQDNNEDLLTHT